MNDGIPPGGKDPETGQWLGLDKLVLDGTLLLRIGGYDPVYFDLYDFSSHLGDEYIIISSRRSVHSIIFYLKKFYHYFPFYEILANVLAIFIILSFQFEIFMGVPPKVNHLKFL